MKKIVCEICESNDFLKDNGIFICQGCGCKYSAAEIRNMLVDGDDGKSPSQSLNEEPLQDEEEEEIEIPMHTPYSPNKLTVSVIKTGHETYTAASVASLSAFFGEPKPVFVEGPDSVGHIGVEISVRFISGKVVKYVGVYLEPFNAVGDIVCCTVDGESERRLEITGPFLPGQSWEGYGEGMWYNNTIVNARINRVHVVYMDETEEMYDGREFYNFTPPPQAAPVSPEAPPQPLIPLTVRRHQDALTTKTNKLNRLTCVLSTGETFELGLSAANQSYTLYLRPGTYSIALNFWGQSLVPQKNRRTPDFILDRPTLIDLTVDPVMGGFKTDIYT